MYSEKTKKIEQRILNSPHVVILGAGASRATCLNGDANGKPLPLMNDIFKILNLKNVKEIALACESDNFEDIYSYIYHNNDYEDLRNQIEVRVYDYFNSLVIPNKPTIYDHLLLSLKKKDVIATFNWDPLIVQAYMRNRHFNLPNLIFLHGNVSIGYCKEHNLTGFKNTFCPKCNKPLEPTSLLYPITEKKYDRNNFITSQWRTLQSYIKRCFFITIFGYSAPKTDSRAIELMKFAWGEINQRNMEQFEIIDIENPDLLHTTWSPFIHSHHYETHKNFYDSWIANYPCRTISSYYSQYWMAEFIEVNPIPKNFTFNELWKWFRRIREES